MITWNTREHTGTVLLCYAVGNTGEPSLPLTHKYKVFLHSAIGSRLSAVANTPTYITHLHSAPLRSSCEPAPRHNCGVFWSPTSLPEASVVAGTLCGYLKIGCAKKRYRFQYRVEAGEPPPCDLDTGEPVRLPG